MGTVTSQTAAAPLIYRLFQEDDLPGMLRLWEEESGWGEITAETWRSWYVDTPHGNCIVAVATDQDGAVAGQLVFTPTRVAVRQETVRALRLSAPVLSHRLRGAVRSIKDHPLANLYNVGIEAARASGYKLVHAFTQSAWLPFFRSSGRLGLPPFSDAEYPCFSRPFAPAVPAPRSGGDYAVARVTRFGDEFQTLWEIARRSFPMQCAIVRDPAWVRYKNNGHLALGVRDSERGSLIGYAAIRLQDGLLVDILARTPEQLTDVLASALGWLSARGGDPALGGLERLKAMDAPHLGPALRALGFIPDDYVFAFICSTLDSSLSLDAVAPKHWYLTPGD
jgi:hypothetical protein